MDWRAGGAALFEYVSLVAASPLLAIAASSTSVILLFALLLLGVRHRRLARRLAGQTPGTAGMADGLSRDPDNEIVVRTPIDRLLRRRAPTFYLLAFGLSVGCWLAGLALAPSIPRFLQSPEWHVQPPYLAAHFIALYLFLRLFVCKYLAGAVRLDMPKQRLASDLSAVLGLKAGLLAVAIALPFCALDYRYLVSDEYEKLSEDQTLHVIDYVMWGLWCAEWLVNAFIWVTLAGFLALSYRALRTYRFRAPIAVVVQEKLYRPFLQLSSQGATIVLGFACITALYIWYAGGAVSDFLGLAVTGLLLVVGFIPLWLLLNAKVKRTVREEIEALRRSLPAALAGDRTLAGASAADGRARSVEERLDEVLALMRAWHLERLQLDLGRTEAQALAVRLAAPAATVGWQLYSNLPSILGKLAQTLGMVLAAILKLFT
jgi:hypothetical protein